MNVRKLIAGAVFLVALFLAVPRASAEPLLFSFSDGVNSFSFTLDRNPTSITAVDVDQFFISRVPNTSATNPFDVYFFTNNAGPDVNFGGGITFALDDTVLLGSLGYFDFSSLQLFTGTTSDPHFITGIFQLVGYDVGGGSVPFATLSIAAIPEASTWAMMIFGFAGVCFMTHRRRKVAALSA